MVKNQDFSTEKKNISSHRKNPQPLFSLQFRSDLRTAILMRDILGPPRALKPFQFPFNR